MDLSSITGRCRFQLTSMKHNSAFLFVDSHMVIILPFPYGLPGFSELFLPCTNNGNIICICKHLITFTVQRVKEIINEYREKSGANYATLNNPLVDKRLLFTIEHFCLTIKPFDGVAKRSVNSKLFKFAEDLDLRDIVEGRFEVNE